MMFTISKTQKKMRKVSDICAAFHKEDFGERFISKFLRFKICEFAVYLFTNITANLCLLSNCSCCFFGTGDFFENL